MSDDPHLEGVEDMSPGEKLAFTQGLCRGVWELKREIVAHLWGRARDSQRDNILAFGAQTFASKAACRALRDAARAIESGELQRTTGRRRC